MGPFDRRTSTIFVFVAWKTGAFSNKRSAISGLPILGNCVVRFEFTPRLAGVLKYRGFKRLEIAFKSRFSPLKARMPFWPER